jgi:cell division protein FtsW (lipid II flippase)
VSESDEKLVRKRFLFYQLPYLVLYVAALGLVAMTAHDAAGSREAWEMFIPVVALVTILGGWRWAGTSAKERWIYVGRQVLHWAALFLVVQLLYAHAVQDFLNDEQDAFVLIYLVGLAALLAGLYVDWKMALFGIFLVFGGVALAWFNDNWLMVVLVVGVVAVVATAASLLIRGHLLSASDNDVDSAA